MMMLMVLKSMLKLLTYVDGGTILAAAIACAVDGLMLIMLIFEQLTLLVLVALFHSALVVLHVFLVKCNFV